MEETTLTDRTDGSVTLYVFVEDDSKALDAVQQADRRFGDIYRNAISRSDLILASVLKRADSDLLDLKPDNYGAIIHRLLRIG